MDSQYTIVVSDLSLEQNNIGYSAGDVDGHINSFSRFSSRYSRKALSSIFDKVYMEL